MSNNTDIHRSFFFFFKIKVPPGPVVDHSVIITTFGKARGSIKKKKRVQLLRFIYTIR